MRYFNHRLLLIPSHLSLLSNFMVQGSGGGFAANIYRAMPGEQTSGFRSLMSKV